MVNVLSEYCLIILFIEELVGPLNDLVKAHQAHTLQDSMDKT